MCNIVLTVIVIYIDLTIMSFKAGLSQNIVNYIETEKRTPNLHTILSICKALEINPAILFESQNTERQQARETIIELVSKFL